MFETTYIDGRRESFAATYGPSRHEEYSQLARLYNRRIGPILGVTVHRPHALQLGMYGSSCDHLPVGRVIRDLSRHAFPDTGSRIPIGGKGPRAEQALLGTLGEGAERLLAVLHGSAVLDRVRYATYDELTHEGREALAPEDMPLFSAEQYEAPQFPFSPFEPDSRLGWIEGVEMLSGSPILVPAQLVLFYWQTGRKEPRIGFATSGGMAFHTDRARAILHGIYENFERDAINLRWYCRQPPPRVTLDLESYLEHTLGVPYPRMATPYIGPVTLFLNTLDAPIPIFTALAVDTSRTELALLAGGGAWSSRDRALAQAVYEIGQMQTGFSLYPERWRRIPRDAPARDLVNFFYASVVYGYRENLHRLDEYRDGGPVVSWEDVPDTRFTDSREEYAWICEWLKQAGMSPILFDFGSACSPGMSLTKVLIPQLTQAFVPACPLFGHPRFYNVPEGLGVSGRPQTPGDLNPDPLPFP